MTLYGCHNRPEFVRSVPVQDGWRISGVRRLVEQPFRMAPDCNYTHTALGQSDERCANCRHRFIADSST